MVRRSRLAQELKIRGMYFPLFAFTPRMKQPFAHLKQLLIIKTIKMKNLNLKELPVKTVKKFYTTKGYLQSSGYKDVYSIRSPMIMETLSWVQCTLLCVMFQYLMLKVRDMKSSTRYSLLCLRMKEPTMTWEISWQMNGLASLKKKNWKNSSLAPCRNAGCFFYLRVCSKQPNTCGFWNNMCLVPRHKAFLTTLCICE